MIETIVAPGTLLTWIRDEKKGKKKTPAKRGRRRTPEEIRKLVLKLARENEWDYTRILGELKKLGIRSLSKNTVNRIPKDAGYDPATSGAKEPGTNSSSSMPRRSGSATSSRIES